MIFTDNRFKSLYFIIITVFIYLILSTTIMLFDSNIIKYILSVMSLFFAAYFLYKYFVSKELKKILNFRFFLFFIFLQVIVGLLHYLILINPNFFDNIIVLYKHPEYALTDYLMNFIGKHWVSKGFFTPLPENFVATYNHIQLYSYMSLNYFFSGSFLLSLANWNVLHYLITVLILIKIADVFDISVKKQKAIFAIAMVQPLSLLSTVLSRDITGQMLLFLAIYLVFLQKSEFIPNFIFLLLSLFLSSLLRTQYILVIIIVYFYYILYRKQYRSLFFSILLVLIIGFAFNQNILSIIESFNFGAYIPKGNFFAIFSNFFKNLLGPFPWTNIFRLDFWELLIFDYLQVCYNLTLYILVIISFFYKKIKLSNPVFIVFLVLLIIGGFNDSHHITYLSVGSILIVPFVIENKFYINFYLIFSFFLLLFIVGSGIYDLI